MMRGEVTMGRFFFVCTLIAVVAPGLHAQNDLRTLRWHAWEEGVREAHASGKYLLIDVYTTWCGWCKKMDHDVYGNARVQELLAAWFVPIKLDAESETVVANGTGHYTERECAKLLDVKGYPTIIVFDSNFQMVTRFSGYRDPEKFIRFLHYVGDKQYERYSFEQYLKKVSPVY
jgi:thioredoxin-related protein